MYKQFTTDILQLTNFVLNDEGEPVSDGWILGVEPKAQQCYVCPYCFERSTNHARDKYRVLKHAWVSTEETIYLKVPVHRQRCEDCGITWTVQFPEIPCRGTVTTHFKQMISRKCIKQSFADVSRDMQVPESTVAHWFYQYAEDVMADPENYDAPSALCLDEFAHKKGHSYSIALMDANTGHVWQTSPGKDREKIQEALKQYPFSAPSVVSTDLAPGMAKTVQEVWPETSIVADKFHVIQLFTKALEYARRLDKNYATNHKKIRHQRRLLMTKPEKLKEDEIETLNDWLSANPKLSKLYQFLQDFREFYDHTEYDLAKQCFENYCQHYLFDGTGHIQKIVKTLLQWKQEILNYFKYSITNAPLEGTNNLIKTIKRRSYGCPNLDNFNLRIRMECKQPTA
ncbi:ISL3 family transposase [Piscibacillus halophilus]|uniref:ISL3 family transposase n=1 Tax=Piscibacillus halophilus TaxID=571933 RepID=UPI00158F6542|nr:ISL3 family transposase [Piscibacillus halophilus]